MWYHCQTRLLWCLRCTGLGVACKMTLRILEIVNCRWKLYTLWVRGHNKKGCLTNYERYIKNTLVWGRSTYIIQKIIYSNYRAYLATRQLSQVKSNTFSRMTGSCAPQMCIRCISARRPTRTSNLDWLWPGCSLYPSGSWRRILPTLSMASISMARERLGCCTRNSSIMWMVRWCVSLVQSSAINYVHIDLGCFRTLRTSSLMQ